jgi:hypothetical protein
MQITQEYYTAETQDIPITVIVVASMVSGDVKAYENVLSLKVISDVIIRKSTVAASTSVRGQRARGTLDYNPIITTFGRGGAVTRDPFEAILSSLSITKANWEYELPTYIPSTLLTKTPYVSSVSASPAGANVEITTTTSLYLAAPRVYIYVTAIDPNL